MRVNYGGIFIEFFTAHLQQSVMVKKFENRLAFRRVTGKNKEAPFFLDTVYIHTFICLLDSKKQKDRQREIQYVQYQQYSIHTCRV